MLTRIVLTRNPNLNYIAIAAASLLSKCRVLECEIHLDVLPDSLIGRRVVSERNTRHSAVGEVRRQGGFSRRFATVRPPRSAPRLDMRQFCSLIKSPLRGFWRTSRRRPGSFKTRRTVPDLFRTIDYPSLL